ncbi:MAG: hypothetical protein D6737_09770 [Chloroflexi bacterium]|nr:MAG: hypothetical protein D6737_09770 [Chloroflexota bacterium]
MITWYLWRRLDNASIALPVRTYLLTHYGTLRVPADVRRRLKRLMPIIIVITGSLIVGSLFVEPTIFFIFTQLPFVLAIMIAFTAPIWFFPAYVLYGAWLSMRIADAIAGVKDSGIYDLLAVTPGGIVDLNQSLSAGIIATSKVYSSSFRTFQWVITFGTLAIWTIIFGLMGASPPGSLRADLLDLAINMPMLAIIATIELYGMAVVSTIIALITTRHTPSRADARIAAAGLFAFVQIMTYVLIVIGVFIIIPLVQKQFDASSRLATIVFAVLRFAVYFAVREGVVRLLWQRLHDEGDAVLFEATTIR